MALSATQRRIIAKPDEAYSEASTARDQLASLDDSVTTAEESLRLARSLDYNEGIIDALWLMGWLNYPKLDGTAVPYFDESIERAHAIDHVFGAVHAHAWYGVYKIGVADYEGAKLALREGMAQAERLGDYAATKLPLREGALQAERIGGDATLLGRCAA